MTEVKGHYGRAVRIRLYRDGLLIACEATAEDGAVTSREVKAVDMRGAKREVTGQLEALGYAGADRWHEGGDGAVRTFRLSDLVQAARAAGTI